MHPPLSLNEYWLRFDVSRYTGKAFCTHLKPPSLPYTLAIEEHGVELAVNIQIVGPATTFNNRSCLDLTNTANQAAMLFTLNSLTDQALSSTDPADRGFLGSVLDEPSVVMLFRESFGAHSVEILRCTHGLAIALLIFFSLDTL